MKIKPSKLNPGETIGIISPAGAAKDINQLNNAVKYFEQNGYKVKTAPHMLDKKGYLAGEDKNRLSDLENFFRDDEVKAIMCSRGGYGTIRLLNGINWDLMKENPKIFVGYSDITTLLCNMAEKSNMVTFHGPLAASDFGVEKVNEYTETSFWNIVTGKAGIPHSFRNVLEYHCLKPGKAEGELIGGNLAVLCGLIGTPYFPDLSGKILLLEDICEPVYKIDRLLYQLKLSGAFDKVAGVLFGEFTLVPEPDEGGTHLISVLDVLSEMAKELKIPVGYGFPAGHGVCKATLPIGVGYYFDAANYKLEIIEDYIAI
jgi:muramoyltetrapeptide carboxypeptidase